MNKFSPISAGAARGLVGFATGLWLAASGCGSNDNAPAYSNGGSNATGGASSTSTGSGGSSTTTSSVACIPEAKGEKTHSVGNYDNLSCTKADCHVGRVGGWVYASAKGFPWVSGATITVTNQDGSTLKAVTGDDGFFDFGENPKLSSPYKVCVSKCPTTDCNLTPHTSSDCLSSGCHALPTQRIFSTTNGATGTGGTSGNTGTNCKAPASGGPYVHVETIYSASNNQPCKSCHSEPTYVGGFLYDGPTSNKTVPEATIVLTPANGAPVTTVTGPDGMFFFGTNATKVVVQSIPTPYTACVSKCPTASICSKTNEHTTNADCGTCHDGSTTDRVYLK